MVLLKDAESLAGSDDDVTTGGFDYTRENLKEGRLAGTICTDESVAVALCELDVNVLEEGSFTKSKRDVSSLNHVIISFRYAL